jgi:transcription termination factor Rho
MPNKKDTIAESTSLKELEAKTLTELRKIASKLGIKDAANYKKSDLLIKILAAETKKGGNIFAEGFLEIIKDSHGVLRSLSMLPGENDVYVSSSQIKRFNLRQGDFISGQARPPKEGERYLSLLKIEAINGSSPDKAISRPAFNRLTPIYPNEQIKLETDQNTLSTRIIDLLCPIGKGQRGMIVAPPKVGKTWLMKDIAKGIATNHPEIHLMVLLVGERPEEVTDMQRFVQGEVIAANFDEHPEAHTRIAEMAVERAKRLVEQEKKDVVILMDSITRLARAYNITAPPSGRTLSGGFDPVAIYPPKKFFGAARNIEQGGSLTIIATALVDTGSKMDDVIFEEFKGTGNMEVKLDRRLAERRIFPAIDVRSSYTRNEDKLLPPEILAETWKIVRMLDTIDSETKENATQVLIDRLKKTKNNEEFLATLHEPL